MRVIARPVPARPRYALPELSLGKRPRVVHGAISLCLLAVILPGIHLATGSSTRQQAAAVNPGSWLRGGTLLTVYGRGFGIAPVLGRLGQDRSMDDVDAQTAPVRAEIARTGGGPTRLAIHLIYGLATPCAATPHCLLYLDGAGLDLVKEYIEPAAQRGWLVVLDDQLGRSTPAAEIGRLIRRGYLRYDNVEVAFDPEFRTVPGQATPGVPTGSVTARQLNRAEARLNAYAARLHLRHRKLMLVHEWQSGMIAGRTRVHTTMTYVRPVFVMDGIGTPAEKAGIYGSLFGPDPVPHLVTGIKLFPANPAQPANPSDTPLLTWNQIFGRAPIEGAASQVTYLRPRPRVIVLT
jgi:hypothetical protein